MASLTFQLDKKEKARLKALADSKTAEGPGEVSMAALVCVALRRYLDDEEKPRRKRK